MTFTPAPIPGTLVLGVGHKAQHGKSTVAKRWMQTHPLAERFELSTYVATVARVMRGMTTRHVPTLIEVGQGARALDPDTWLRCAYFDILEKRPPLAIIPNIRFENEARLVTAMGGYLVNVRRVNADGSPFVSPDRDPHAITETALDGFDGWDFRITAATTGELEQQADTVLETILMLDAPEAQGYGLV